MVIKMNKQKSMFGRFYSLSLLLVLLATALLPMPARGEAKRLLFVNNTDSSTCADRMVYEVFKTLGYSVSIDTMAMSDAMESADLGRYDGMCKQTIEIESQYENLVRVPNSIGVIQFIALVRDSDDTQIAGWSDLAERRIGCLEQKINILSSVPDNVHSMTLYGSLKELYDALRGGRIDVAVTTHNFSSTPLLPVGMRISGELSRESTFIYLHKKHAALVPQVAQAIDRLKRTGVFERIQRGEKLGEQNIKSVLFLTSNTSEMVWEQHIYEGVSRVLDQNDQIVFHNIALNAQRLVNDVSRDQAALAAIRADCLASPPDAVICAGDEALSFAVNNYNVLFCNVPVIYCGVLAGRPETLIRPEDATVFSGLTFEIPAAQLMDEVLRLRPNTERAFIINDQSVCGKLWQAEIQRQLKPFQDRIQITYAGDQSFSDLVAQVAALDGDSAVLSGWYFMDSQDLYIPQAESQQRLTAATDAPVFGLIEGGANRGQLGGLYINGIRQGEYAAHLVCALFSDCGKSTALSGENAHWQFDNGALARFRITASRLPQGAEILGRTLSLRESDPRLFTILATSGFSMLLIIIALAIFSHVLKRKNAKLKEARDESHRAVLEAEDSKLEAERVRNRLQMIVRTAPVAYCLLVNNRVCESNEYYDKIFGTPLGTDLDEKYADTPSFAALMKHLTSADQVTGALAHLRVRGGQVKRFACSAANTLYKNEPATVIWSLDIEEMERKKEEIAIAKQEALQGVIEKQIEANRLKSHFLMNISHELKTPMNAIIGLSQLAKKTDDAEHLYASIARIGSAASVLLGIVDQVLDLSMIEEGRVSLRPQKTDVEPLIRRVIDTMQPSADPQHIAIRLDATELVHRSALMDEARVCQVLMALLSNAVKFSPEGGEVLVKVREEPVSASQSCYRFSVLDRGPGIPPEKRDRLFNAFEQVDDGITRKHGGIGLGLTIAQKLVHLMDGDIDYESELGKGSEFFFWFHAEPFGELEAPAAQPQVDLSRIRALVVDDVDINRIVLMGQLEALGVQCEEAENGQVAVELFQASEPDHFDLVLMDIQMPIMDGYTAARALRALPRTDVDRLLILAVSANNMPEDIRQSRASGMDDHLAKPFYPEQLKEKIEALLAQR